ncbi:Fc.00g033020.m01.CDS01 [Cosmosporella sp. VM-42]
MVSFDSVVVLATSLLGTVTAYETTLKTVTTTASCLTITSSPSSEADEPCLTGVPAPSSDAGSSLSGVPAPSSTITGPWLGSSNTESISEPEATNSKALGVSHVVPIGQGDFVPLSCFPKKSQDVPQGTICAKEGFIASNWMNNAYSGPADTEFDCLRDCTMTRGCTAWAYDNYGICWIGTRPWAEADFIADNDGGGKTWNQVECYECYDNTIFRLDFEDGKFDDWLYEWDESLNWLMDSPNIDLDRALRIGEPEDNGTLGKEARVIYSKTFPLESLNPYYFGYKMRIERNNDLVKNYDSVTFTISTNDEIVYEFTPEQAESEFSQGFHEFSLLSKLDMGEATFSIWVSSTGHGYDYYFSHFFVSLVV